MRIAIAGLGHVGTATVCLLKSHQELLRGRGQQIKLVAVSARAQHKDRTCDLSGIDWVDDARTLALRPDVDVVVELIGGADGIALDLARASLANGKHFVTANKALIAAHGVELGQVAEKANLHLSFEAAVCGAVPVLKTLREGLSADRVLSLRGILNGTCNYILTRMQREEVDFATVLADAQRQGYAEADPSDDIDGIDTANKLAILSAVAFGITPDLSAIYIEGIRAVTIADLRTAEAQQGSIKLLGISTRMQKGIVQRVQPVFVPFSCSLSRVDGVLNALEIVSECAGETFIQGRGAGAPTASAIVADLMDIARGARGYSFGMAASSLA